MKRYKRHFETVASSRNSSVNPIRDSVCYVNDPEAYDFTNFNWDLDHQFADYNIYKRWMKRFDNEVD